MEQVYSNNSSNAVGTDLHVLDLAITKTVIGAPLIGDPITYTLVFSYANGDETATNVVITDDIPISITHASLAYSYNGTYVSAVGGTTYVWDVADMTPGSRGIITVTGILSGRLPTQVITNVATIAAAQIDDNPANSVATSTFTAVSLPDLVINKQVYGPGAPPPGGSSATGVPGGPITYTLTFSNEGHTTAIGVIITDDLPATVTNVSVVSSGVAITSTGAAPAYEWDVAPLAPGDSGSITLVGVLPQPLPAEVFTNTAFISNNLTDKVPGNNSSAVFVYHCGNTVTVVNANDSGPGSLRQAVFDVCPGGLINFSMTYPAVITLTSGQIEVHKPVTIDGPGATNVAVSGNNASRIFNMSEPVSIDALTLRDGYTADNGGAIQTTSPLTLAAVAMLSNSADDYSGAVFGGSTVLISDSLFQENQAANSGAVWSSGPALITNTRFISNSATGDVGAFWVDSPAEIWNSFFQGNSADTYGALRAEDNLAIHNTAFLTNTAVNEAGAMYARRGEVIIEDSLFQGNSAGDYAGVMELYSSAAITDTRFIGNSSRGEDGAGFGVGAIYAGEPLTLKDSLFKDNKALNGFDAGAFYTYSTVEIINTDFINNSAGRDGGAVFVEGQLTIVNSLLAGNQAGNGRGEALYLNGSGTSYITHTTIASATQGSGSALYVAGGTLEAANNIIANYSTGINNAGGTVNEDNNLFAGNGTDRVGVTAGANSLSSSNASDAGFVDAAGGDFHLTSESWAVDKGTAAGVTVDFEADVRPGGNAFDLGYDETTFTGPVAVDDPESTDEDVALLISPLTNDTENDGDTLFIGQVGTSLNGTLTLSGTTQFTYTPAANWYGTDVFTYTVKEASQLSDIGTITVTVASINDAPVITNSHPVSVTMSEDGSPIPWNLTLYATDVESSGPALTWSVVTQPISGTATAIGSGSSKVVGFTPPDDFFGSAVFTVAVTDGELTDTVAVSVTVTPVNDAPVAVDDLENTDEDTPLTFSPLTNDIDVDGDILHIAQISTPISGTATLSGTTQVVYTPTLNFYGTDTFVYSVSDGQIADFGIITITVAPVNDAPVITNTRPVLVTMSEDNSPITWNLTLYATDIESSGPALTWSVATQGSHGVATATGTGDSKAIGYLPDLHWYGTDVFTIAVSDGELTDTVAVTVTALPENDPPQIIDARPLTVTMSEDGSPIPFALTLHAVDPDPIDVIVWTVDDQPDHGRALASGVGGSKVITYTPPANWYGTTVFTVSVADGEDSDAISVTVVVLSVNDAPLAVDDNNIMIRRDDDDNLFVLASDPVTIPVLLNDSDPTDNVFDSSGLTVGAVGSGSQGGTVAIHSNNLWVEYTPTDTFTGTEVFTYTARDSGGLEDTATVTVTVVNGDGGGKTEPDDADGKTIIIPKTGISGTITLTIHIPAGVADDTFALIYNELDTPGRGAPTGYQLAGLYFTLEAYLNQQLQPDYVFATPITMTLTYSDSDVADILRSEGSLTLLYWDADAGEWSSDGITVVERNTANNRLVVTIAHLTEFGLFGKPYNYYHLPILFKDFSP
jgi:uncharacterized repeat protein (TIGR01451 family)